MLVLCITFHNFVIQAVLTLTELEGSCTIKTLTAVVKGPTSTNVLGVGVYTGRSAVS